MFSTITRHEFLVNAWRKSRNYFSFEDGQLFVTGHLTLNSPLATTPNLFAILEYINSKLNKSINQINFYKNPLGKELESFCNLLETSLFVSSTARCNFVLRLDVLPSSTFRMARQVEKLEKPPKLMDLHTFGPFIQFNGNQDGLDPKSFQSKWGFVPSNTITDFKAIKSFKTNMFPRNACYAPEPSETVLKTRNVLRVLGKAVELKRWGLSSNRWTWKLGEESFYFRRHASVIRPVQADKTVCIGYSRTDVKTVEEQPSNCSKVQRQINQIWTFTDPTADLWISDVRVHSVLIIIFILFLTW